MTRDQALAIISSAITSQFGVATDSVTEETVALDVAGWDSFSNGLLVMAIEERAGCPLPFDELAAAANVGDMADILAKNA